VVVVAIVNDLHQVRLGERGDVQSTKKKENIEYRNRISNFEGRCACGASIFIIDGAKRLIPSIFDIRHSLFLFHRGVRVLDRQKKGLPDSTGLPF